jgi:predicted metalloendopeptidase
MKRAFENIIAWKVVSSALETLPKKYRDALSDFEKAVKGAASSEDITTKCVDEVNSVMEFATGEMYVKQKFDEKAKQIATDMINNIKKEMKVLISETKWMDKRSRDAALEKADYIEPYIGYPDWILNSTKLNDYYKDVNLKNYSILFKKYKKKLILFNQSSMPSIMVLI